MRRVIEQYLEDPLAEKLLLNPTKGGSWLVSEQDDKLLFIDQEPPENKQPDMEMAGPQQRSSL